MGTGKNLSVKMARRTQASMDESAAGATSKQLTPAMASPPGLQNTMMMARGGKLFDETPEHTVESKIRSINGATVSHYAGPVANSQFSQDLCSQKEFGPMLVSDDPDVLYHGNIHKSATQGLDGKGKQKKRERTQNVSTAQKGGPAQLK